MIAYENLKHITPDMVVLESIGTTISPMTGLSYAVMQDGKHYDPDTETYIGEIDVDEYMGTISNDDEITFMAIQDQELNDYERYYKFAKGGKIEVGENYRAKFSNKFNKRVPTDFKVVSKFKGRDDMPMVEIITENGVRANMSEKDLKPLMFAKGGEVITDSFGDKYELEFARAGKTKAVPFAKGGLLIEGVRFGKESEDLEDYLDNNSWEVIEKDNGDKGTKFTLSMKDVEYEQRVDLEDYLDNNNLKYIDNYAKGGDVEEELRFEKTIKSSLENMKKGDRKRDEMAKSKFGESYDELHYLKRQQIDDEWNRRFVYGNEKLAKGGKTDWVQSVVDSPNFRKGAFTKKAKAKGMTPTEFMKKVLANPSNYNMRTRRQAQFMKNI